VGRSTNGKTKPKSPIRANSVTIQNFVILQENMFKGIEEL
jgi:hypothetical protein